MSTNEHDDLGADALEQSIAEHPITLGAPEALDFGEERPVNALVGPPAILTQRRIDVRASVDPTVLNRVYKQILAFDATPTCQATLHIAVAMMGTDPASVLTEAQRDWVMQRCAQKIDATGNPLPWAPFNEQESRKLVPLLLAWSAGKTWQDAMIDGLRGVVPAELLPEVQKAC